MWPLVLITVYCALIVAASLLGGWLPRLVHLTHRRMQMMMSFVGGIMLGVALLHLLPHAVSVSGALDKVSFAALLGVLTVFMMIRVFRVHQHGVDDQLRHEHADDHECGERCHELSPHASPHEHAHHERDHHERRATHSYRLSWLGLFFGLAIHTLIDGVALAASVAAEAHAHHTLTLIGLGTFLAVLLHKPLDALSITAVMAAGGWKGASINLVNVLYSAMCPLGAIAFYAGMHQMGAHQDLVVGLALAFAGGVFLCISLADILPEVQFHSHDRLWLTVLLLAGVLVAFGIGYLEPSHAHDVPDDSAAGSSLEGTLNPLDPRPTILCVASRETSTASLQVRSGVDGDGGRIVVLIDHLGGVIAQVV
jgi:zinc and cadmium transporter